MHYYLADREASATSATARALLLDQDGFVCEASTANILSYKQGIGLSSPKPSKMLPGISLQVVAELAEQLGITFQYRDMSPSEFSNSDEILLCSTTPCIWPCLRLNDNPVGDGVPGPVFFKLVDAWSKLVGVNLLDQ